MVNDEGTNIKYGINEIPEISKPIKTVDKYWGCMSTLFEGYDFTVKRIFMRAGTQSSLEYHCRKKESYYIESGQLKVGIRIGRAKNHLMILNQGDIFHIPVGLMHMRIAEQDCVIIEVSTKDDDGDSYIVEDGRYYKHTEEKQE
jgi:mannose-6-phosphate isomerase